MSTGTGLNVSKANVYVVLEKPVALNVSKANVYAVLQKSSGLNMSKANVYAVLQKSSGLNMSKANVYAVLQPNNSNPPVWPSFTFSNGVVGSAYSQTFDLTPAAPPVTFALASGSLPPGLSLNSLGNTQGALSGTSTTAGTYTFTLSATNSYGSAVSPLFSITIAAPSNGGYAYVWIG